MHCNKLGEIAHAEWLKTATIRHEIGLDEFQIMPNHFHAILFIMERGKITVGAQRRCAPTNPAPHVDPGSIGAIIRAYKSAVTARINRSRGAPGATMWQRDYWEHIIRNQNELTRIREYIRNNPVRWELDTENGGDPMGM
jgi:REP element-mobilizing transposase RayT